MTKLVFVWGPLSSETPQRECSFCGLSRVVCALLRVLSGAFCIKSTRKGMKLGLIVFAPDERTLALSSKYIKLAPKGLRI